MPTKKPPAIRLNIVGERIRQVRLKSKPPLTQDQLSGRLAGIGVTIDRAGLSKIETGRRCVVDFEVRALAKVLGVTADWLLGGKG